MSRLNQRARRRVLGGCALLSIVAIALVGAAGDSKPENSVENTAAARSAGKIIPAFAKTTPSESRQQFVLTADYDKVVGWISGKGDLAGKSVDIEYGGRTANATIQPGNTFTWKYDVQKPVDAVFTLGKLKARERLAPRPKDEPAAYFVVDRTAYRPGQVLHFAAFLRQPDEQGQFAPLPGREVEVKLTSAGKKTTAARLKLTSDDFGRVVGEYRFSDADPLDSYTLSIPGYKGQAELKLAEFRKAKVRLDISGELDGRDLKLTFRSLDFLNKPTAGSKVQFTATVVKDNRTTKEDALDSSKFVYYAPEQELFLDPNRVAAEERALWLAGLVPFPRRSATTHAVAKRTGELNVGTVGQADYTLALDPAWTKGDYSVLVEGVLLDYNGREQRARKVISIGKKTADCDLILNAPKEIYAAGEKVSVQVAPLGKDHKPIDAVATIVAHRLTPKNPGYQPGSYGYGGYGYRGYGYNQYAYHPHHLRGGWNGQNVIYDRLWRGRATARNLRHLQLPGTQSGWTREGLYDPSQVERQTVAATVVRDGRATFDLEQPGAYTLVCFAELPDGRKLRNQVSLVVRKEEDLPGLILRVGNPELKAGERLRGEIHSKFSNARVLLSLRDSLGVQFWKTYQLDDRGVARIDAPLPADLRYGCRLEARYIDKEGQPHLANRSIHVEPTDRTVKVEIKTEPIAEPGEEFVVDLQVDRRQMVDLVVSVYDQSLLGVAKDRSVDIRDFFLADDRARQAASRAMLHRKLAGVTVKSLIEKGEALLKEDKELRSQPAGSMLQQAINHYNQRSNRGYLYSRDLAALLALVGVDARTDLNMPYYGRWYRYFDHATEKTSPVSVLDAMQADRSGWYLKTYYVGDVLMLVEYHKNYAGQYGQLGYQNQAFMLHRGGYGMVRSRADAHFSASANSFQSHAVSGQSFMSHLPGPGPVAEPQLDLEEQSGSVRRDFSDSAYWNALVRTDRQGRARVHFKLPDSLTNWRVVVTAVSPEMHVGRGEHTFRTFKPVMVWPMVPRVFTEGDKVDLYASVHNRTDQEQEIEVALKVTAGRIHSPAKVRVSVPAKGNAPVYWTYEPTQAGYAQILMSAKCAAGSDASLKRLPVARLAAEQVITRSGFAKGRHVINIPAEVDLNNAQLELTFAPTIADDLVQSLDYLVQYPHGCVEQTMSRFLPAIKVAQTLRRAKLTDSDLEKKLPGVVEAGVKRLLELQKPDGGWGWHSGGRTHEMMTPYALFGLLQAEKAGYVIPNETAIERGLNRLGSFISSMGEKQAADRIYCMYVYSHRKPLRDDWWKFIGNMHDKNKLSDYGLALALEMATADNRDDLAGKLAAKLRQRATTDGDIAYWTTANFSRWGNDPYEITAAALKALVAHDANDKLIAPVLNYFATTKRGNRWNSTKATAMVIYAMCDYLAAEDYSFGEKRSLAVDLPSGETAALALTSGKLERVVIPGKQLKKGDNVLAFNGRAPGAMFRAVVRYWQKGKAIKPMEKGLTVTRVFHLLDDKGQQIREIKSGDRVPRGSYIRSRVIVKHKLGQAMNYVLVENPKPSTCEIVPADDKRFSQASTTYALREDKTRGVVWHHESTGHTIDNMCTLHAELAGEYHVPPAKVELMYQTQTRGHSGAFFFRVGEEPAKTAAR